MNVETTNKDSQAALIKKLRIQRLINLVLLLAIASGLLLYFLYRPKPIDLSEVGEKRFGPVDPVTAQKNMGIYRQKGAYASLSLHPDIKVTGILHDAKEFKDYVDKYFDNFVATHTPKPGYKWQVGVYPMVCKETTQHPNKPRIGVYFIPTMVEISTARPMSDRIMDYIAVIGSSDYIYYLKDTDRTNPSREKLDDDDYIFDEGHLWP